MNDGFIKDYVFEITTELKSFAANRQKFIEALIEWELNEDGTMEFSLPNSEHSFLVTHAKPNEVPYEIFLRRLAHPSPNETERGYVSLKLGSTSSWADVNKVVQNCIQKILRPWHSLPLPVECAALPKVSRNHRQYEALVLHHAAMERLFDTDTEARFDMSHYNTMDTPMKFDAIGVLSVIVNNECFTPDEAWFTMCSHLGLEVSSPEWGWINSNLWVLIDNTARGAGLRWAWLLYSGLPANHQEQLNGSEPLIYELDAYERLNSKPKTNATVGQTVYCFSLGMCGRIMPPYGLQPERITVLFQGSHVLMACDPYDLAYTESYEYRHDLTDAL